MRRSTFLFAPSFVEKEKSSIKERFSVGSRRITFGSLWSFRHVKITFETVFGRRRMENEKREKLRALLASKPKDQDIASAGQSQLRALFESSRSQGQREREEKEKEQREQREQREKEQREKEQREKEQQEQEEKDISFPAAFISGDSQERAQEQHSSNLEQEREKRNQEKVDLGQQQPEQATKGQHMLLSVVVF